MPMIQFKIYRFLEKAGYLALPVAPSGFFRYRDYKDMKGGFIADFSHRHAAVAAGLGEFGRQGLLLTPQFGVRQRLCSIITSAPLNADPLFGGPSLCDGCEACLKACPVDAFHKTEQHSVRIGEKAIAYAKVDKWRCAWVEQLGMVGEGGPKYEGYTTDVAPPDPVRREDYLAAIAHCDAVVSTDTAAGHLAEALGKPNLILYGPTRDQLWIKYYKKTLALRAEYIGKTCKSPCGLTKDTSSGCPEAVLLNSPYSPCLLSINAEKIVAGFENMLKTLLR